MVSRREFLRGGAAAGLLSAAPVGLVGAATHPGPALAFEAVCDTRWEEGNQFLAALGSSPYRAHGVGTDPGAVLGMLPAAIAARRPVVGISTDAALLLAEHLAGREGYRLVFHSDHEHTPTDTLTHTLRGERDLLDALERPLAQGGARWPALLACHAGALAVSRGGDQRRSVQARATRPAASPGHLAVWALAPAPV